MRGAARWPLALPALVVAALVGAPPAGAAPRAGVELTARPASCASSPQEARRSAGFTVVSSAPRGGRHAVRVDLQVREGGRWRTLPPAAGFGDWDRSRDGVGRFVVRHRVSALVPGLAYRVRARTIWRDASGESRRRTVRSRPCVQRELRPDLAVLGLGARGEGAFTADVVVRDAARLDGAPRWSAELDGVPVGGGELARTGAVQRLELGPFACPSAESELRLRLDPDDAVDERDERSGEARIPCLAPAGAGGTLGSP